MEVDIDVVVRDELHTTIVWRTAYRLNIAEQLAALLAADDRCEYSTSCRKSIGG